MKVGIRSEDIFTPQGRLEEVEKNPNLDFLMNLFNIGRAFGVSGFGGNWDVGKHSFATALIALFWAKFNKFEPEKRDKFVCLALCHDLHEAVTGDILPMLKTQDVKTTLNRIQDNILEALGLAADESLTIDLKIVDLAAFLYEIKKVSPNILARKQLELAHAIALHQRQNLLVYAKGHGISKKTIEEFLKQLEL